MLAGSESNHESDDIPLSELMKINEGKKARQKHDKPRERKTAAGTVWKDRSGEGKPAATNKKEKGPASEGEVSGPSVFEVRSSITVEKLKLIREELHIPKLFLTLAPSPNDIPSRPPPGYGPIHHESLLCGLSYPLQPIVQELLAMLQTPFS